MFTASWAALVLSFTEVFSSAAFLISFSTAFSSVLFSGVFSSFTLPSVLASSLGCSFWSAFSSDLLSSGFASSSVALSSDFESSCFSLSSALSSSTGACLASKAFASAKIASNFSVLFWPLSTKIWWLKSSFCASVKLGKLLIVLYASWVALFNASSASGVSLAAWASAAFASDKIASKSVLFVPATSKMRWLYASFWASVKLGKLLIVL